MNERHLIKSASNAAVGKNIKTEKAAGYSQAQATAIALHTQDEAKKKQHKHAADAAALFPPNGRQDSEGWEPVGF